MSRIRVEELSRGADVSVDTIRFYQKRRLLPPPTREGRIAWYGPEHLERLREIKELQGRGLSLSVIRRLLSGELDPSDEPLVEAVFGAGRAGGADTEVLLTLEQLSQQSGVPPALVDAVVREGLLVPRRHEDGPRFTPADVDIVAAGLQLLEAGLPMPELLGLARRHHAATRETAEAAVALFDSFVRHPLKGADLTDDERAEHLVAAFRMLLPAVTKLVEHHFERVLLEVALEHLEAVGEPAELAAAAESNRGVEAIS
jgi:DNA-binding transcriptional MerR regulator